MFYLLGFTNFCFTAASSLLNEVLLVLTHDGLFQVFFQEAISNTIHDFLKSINKPNTDPKIRKESLGKYHNEHLYNSVWLEWVCYAKQLMLLQQVCKYLTCSSLTCKLQVNLQNKEEWVFQSFYKTNSIFTHQWNFFT